MSDVHLIKADMVFCGFFLTILKFCKKKKKPKKNTDMTTYRQIIDVLTRITPSPDGDNRRMSHDILKPYHCRFSSFSHRNAARLRWEILHETDQYRLGRSHPDTVDQN